MSLISDVGIFGPNVVDRCFIESVPLKGVVLDEVTFKGVAVD